MRNKVAKITFLVVFVNIVALYYSWRLISKFGQGPLPIDVSFNKPPTRTSNRHVSKLVTVVLRDFEPQDNDVTQTVESFLNVFPNIQVLVVCDELPYPPLELMFSNATSRNVKIVNLSLNLKAAYRDHYPLFNIKTKYVFFVPDSTRINARHVLQSMISEIGRRPDKMLAVPFVNAKRPRCLNIKLDLRQWTVVYEDAKNDSCDAVGGKHAVLVETHVLRRLPDAFLTPFPEALYLQTSSQGLKVAQMREPLLQNGRAAARSARGVAERRRAEAAPRRRLYTRLGLKKVVRADGGVEWYGCTRDSARCFGAVLDAMPSYLYQGRWTPPCCLANLRSVTRHVLDRLREAGVRHWLDGGSLLGAMRAADLLPWGHDVDVGLYRDDIGRCRPLAQARTRPLVDSRGFVWEKATEGDFYRVHYSRTNRVHVNLFPFLARNGTMTKDAWFPAARRRVDFPDHFLHPMSSIPFLGRLAPCPNNIRDFLELKFGRGAVERPRYPDPSRLRFT